MTKALEAALDPQNYGYSFALSRLVSGASSTEWAAHFRFRLKPEARGTQLACEVLVVSGAFRCILEQTCIPLHEGIPERVLQLPAWVWENIALPAGWGEDERSPADACNVRWKKDIRQAISEALLEG